MEVTFANAKLEKLCNSEKNLRKKFGPQMVRKIQRRLTDLSAAANLAVMRTLPGNCHDLRENWSGHFALDLEQPDRLVCRPINDPLPINDSGQLDWGKVTKIEVVWIGDYHKK